MFDTDNFDPDYFDEDEDLDEDFEDDEGFYDGWDDSAPVYYDDGGPNGVDAYSYYKDDMVDESDWHLIWVESQEQWYDLRDPQVKDYLSRWQILAHLIRWVWAWKIHGPAFRLWKTMQRPFRRCVNCGKWGVGPYWFSDTCSWECSKEAFVKHTSQHRVSVSKG